MVVGGVIGGFAGYAIGGLTASTLAQGGVAVSGEISWQGFAICSFGGSSGFFVVGYSANGAPVLDIEARVDQMLSNFNAAHEEWLKKNGGTSKVPGPYDPDREYYSTSLSINFSVSVDLPKDPVELAVFYEKLEISEEINMGDCTTALAH